jgi:DnaK suppressor protein
LIENNKSILRRYDGFRRKLKAHQPIYLFILAQMGFSLLWGFLYSKAMNQTTHSATFIHEMKARLEQEKALLQKELGVIADRSSDEGYIAKFPEYGEDEESNAMEMADYQATAAITASNKERLKTVEAALERLAEGRYGVTDDGQLIPEERLRANPAATTLV